MAVRAELASRCLLAALIGLGLACGSSDAAPATTASDGASASGTAATAAQAGVSGNLAGNGSGNAGAAGEAAGNGPAAGASGLSGNMMMDAHVCTIPDDIAIGPEDGDDAGVAPDCVNVPRTIIGENCIGGYCHDNVGPPAAGLDLMSPCVADRLVNVRSTCMDLLLLDPAQPANSFLSDKVNTTWPKCGKSMPDGGHLPTDQLRCMNAWIKAVLRAAH